MLLKVTIGLISVFFFKKFFVAYIVGFRGDVELGGPVLACAGKVKASKSILFTEGSPEVKINTCPKRGLN